MQRDILKFGVKRNVKHLQSVVNQIKRRELYNESDAIGGLLKSGQLGWIAIGSIFQVISIKNGNKIASYSFDNSQLSNTLITCVTEVETHNFHGLLAIGIQCSPIGGLLCLFSIQGSRLLRTIEIVDKVTSCSFINANACHRSDLQFFDGCVAVGTDSGKVILIDLELKKCAKILMEQKFNKTEFQTVPCHVVVANISFNDMKKQQKIAKQEMVNFGIQLEVLPTAGPVLSILSLTPLLTIAVGLGDGRLVLYDLCDLQAFHMAYPPESESPLIKLAYIEPADDPRACVYVWAFHTNTQSAIAVMHSIMFEQKTSIETGCIYNNFQSCSPRLTMPIFDSASFPITCQSVSKFITDDENVISLCVLAWSSPSDSYICVFDLNQWYKEQMPSFCNWRNFPTYLALFPLKNDLLLDVWMDQFSVTPFSSIQRPEEHFYPSSLSFDCVTLTISDCGHLHWPGLQNQTLELLNCSGPNAILEPNHCFAEMIKASLIPQFSDYSCNTNQSKKTKQEYLLSMALENNCVGLLRECAKFWADGSHLGNQPSEGLSLSTLTDWIWQRAQIIKDCCNNLCVSLFDYSERPIDLRSQKILLHCSRQLKLLSDLLSMILTTCHQYIPGEVLEALKSQKNSISMASDYQEVLQWLLNMGLLPEATFQQNSLYRNPVFSEFNAVPYPYKMLQNYYVTQRKRFADLNPTLSSTKSCPYLYIDAFIENECNSPVLRKEWKHELGDGLYPPPSLQSLLRILLVPGVPIENKYILFVYLFLDLNLTLNENRYSNAVKKLIKFPAVFKLNPALIKITQAFWHHDHGEFETAIDDLISPLSKDQNLTKWQQELLIKSLLIQNCAPLALRVLRAPGPQISAVLQIQTLLHNNLVAEAFQLQHSKDDQQLLMEFFKGCHEQKKWNYVLDLPLSRREEQLLGNFLRTSCSTIGQNLHFVYLLQRGKYLEAIEYLNDLQHTKHQQKYQNDLDTPKTIISAYKLTMAPITKQLSGLFNSLADNINSRLNKVYVKTPNPLSSKLLDRNLDIAGGVYQCSILSTEQVTTAYWQNNKRKMCNLSSSTVPFLRNPQYDLSELKYKHSLVPGEISYPKEFVKNQKRRIDKVVEDTDDLKEFEIARKRQKISDPTNTPFKEKQADDFWSNTNLNTPLITTSKSCLTKLSPFNQNYDRVSTPHSILKVKIVNRDMGDDSISVASSSRSISPSQHSTRRSVDSDQRSIHFNLPNSPPCFNIDSTDNKALVEGHGLFTTSTQLSLSSFKQENHLPMHATTDTSFHSSMTSNSDRDEFVSPISSPLVEKINPAENVKMILSTFDKHLSEGPKARKRLHSQMTVYSNEYKKPTELDSFELTNLVQATFEGHETNNQTATIIKETLIDRSKNEYNLNEYVTLPKLHLVDQTLEDIDKQKPVSLPNKPIERIIPIELENQFRDKAMEHTYVQSEPTFKEFLPEEFPPKIIESTPMKRKTLSRIVLEASLKKQDAIAIQQQSCYGCNEPSLNLTNENDKFDVTIDSSIVENRRHLLSDNSDVSESFIQQWKERLAHKNKSSPDASFSGDSTFGRCTNVLEDCDSSSLDESYKQILLNKIKENQEKKTNKEHISKNIEVGFYSSSDAVNIGSDDTEISDEEQKQNTDFIEEDEEAQNDDDYGKTIEQYEKRCSNSSVSFENRELIEENDYDDDERNMSEEDNVSEENSNGESAITLSNSDENESDSLNAEVINISSSSDDKLSEKLKVSQNPEIIQEKSTQHLQSLAYDDLIETEQIPKYETSNDLNDAFINENMEMTQVNQSRITDSVNDNEILNQGQLIGEVTVFDRNQTDVSIQNFQQITENSETLTQMALPTNVLMDIDIEMIENEKIFECTSTEVSTDAIKESLLDVPMMAVDTDGENNTNVDTAFSIEEEISEKICENPSGIIKTIDNISTIMKEDVTIGLIKDNNPIESDGNNENISQKSHVQAVIDISDQTCNFAVKYDTYENVAMDTHIIRCDLDEEIIPIDNNQIALPCQSTSEPNKKIENHSHISEINDFGSNSEESTVTVNNSNKDKSSIGTTHLNQTTDIDILDKTNFGIPLRKLSEINTINKNEIDILDYTNLKDFKLQISDDDNDYDDNSNNELIALSLKKNTSKENLVNLNLPSTSFGTKKIETNIMDKKNLETPSKRILRNRSISTKSNEIVFSPIQTTKIKSTSLLDIRSSGLETPILRSSGRKISENMTTPRKTRSSSLQPLDENEFSEKKGRSIYTIATPTKNTCVLNDFEITSTPRRTRASSMQSNDKAELIKQDVEVHKTPNRKSRRLSECSEISIDDLPTSTKKRQQTVQYDNDDINSVTSSVVSVRTTRSSSKKQEILEEDRISNISSSKSKRSVRGKRTILPTLSEESDKLEKVTENDEQISEVYSSSRRLTRNQIAVMNKMQQQQNMINRKFVTKKTTKKVEENDDNPNDGDVDNVSDTETVLSKKSKSSKSKMTTRQVKNRPDNDSSESDLSPQMKKESSAESAKPGRKLRKATAI